MESLFILFLLMYLCCCILSISSVDSGRIEFIPADQRRLVDEGKPILLVCKFSDISNVSVATVEWFRVSSSSADDPILMPAHLIEGVKISEEDDGDERTKAKQLFILKVSAENAGTYRCIAREGAEGQQDVAQEKQAEIVVTEEMKLDNCAEIQNPTEGSDAVIRCRAIGEPGPDTIFWEKDGVQIKPNDRLSFEANKMELLIKNFTSAIDDGEYQLQIIRANPDAILSPKIIVSGYTQPLILNWDGAATAVEDRPITLQCNATGKPHPKITWTKVDENNVSSTVIRDDGLKHKLNPMYGRLEIHDIAVGDKGTYQCKVENPIGEKMARLELDVFRKPRIEPLTNKTIVRDSAAELECTFSGDGDVNVYWSFNGHKLGQPGKKGVKSENIAESASTEMKSANTLVLKISNVQMNHAGEFQCVATNNAGRAVQTMLLSVQHAPELKSKSESPIRSVEGQIASLFCAVEAHPEPTWTWTKDGSEIDYASSKYTLTNDTGGLKSTLTVETTLLSDFGEYHCAADNGVPDAVDEIIEVVRIEIPPIPEEMEAIGQYPNYAIIKLKGAYDDELAVESTPNNVTFYYKKKPDANVDGEAADDTTMFSNWTSTADSVALNYDPGNEYKVSGLDTSTGYYLKAKAANEAGESSLSSEPFLYETLEASVPEKPIFITAARSKCDGPCQLEWTEPNDHGSTILGYRIKYTRISLESGAQDRITEIERSQWLDGIPAEDHATKLADLKPNSAYELQIYAKNEIGEGDPGSIIIHTGEMKSGETIKQIAVIVLIIIILIALVLMVDVGCYYVNRTGIIMTCCVKCCGKPSPSKSVDDTPAVDDSRRSTGDRLQRHDAHEATPMLSVSKNGQTIGV